MKKFILERHAFAPELNRIHFENGASMKTPCCTSIKEVKNKYFKPYKIKLYCLIESTYSDSEYQSLNKVVASGRTESRKKALDFSKKFKQTGGTLLDGSTLPPNKLKFTFYY
jgi:hypothetical protein